MGVHYVPVAPPEEIQPGKLVAADLGGRGALVTRVDDTFYAFARTCPHEATDLSESGEIVGKRVTCDAHNYWFDLETGDCVMPKGGPALAVLPTEIRDGQLCIRLEW